MHGQFGSKYLKKMANPWHPPSTSLNPASSSVLRGKSQSSSDKFQGKEDALSDQSGVNTYLAALEEHEREQQNRQLELAQRGDTDSTSPPGSSIPASLISAVSSLSHPLGCHSEVASGLSF